MTFMNLKMIPLIIITPIIVSKALGKDMREERPWFNQKNCTSLQIKKYKSISDHKVVAEVSIFDLKAINKIIERIEKIPSNGDMMVSFGPKAAHTDLIFNCANSKTEIIQIYQKGFKTPSTGFNSDGNEIEKKLQTDLMALLTPALNIKLLKVENLELNFDGFSVTYKGSKTTTTPATVTFTTDTYIIKDKSGKEQKIEVTSGQTAPKVQAFIVNKKSYSLFPLISSKGEDLLPDYFEINP